MFKKRATYLAAIAASFFIGYNVYKKRKNTLQPVTKSSKKVPPEESKDTMDNFFNVALTAAFKAGEIVKAFWGDKSAKSYQLLTKSSDTDLVTQLDKRCETLILSLISQHFPSHSIVAEESHVSGAHYAIDPTGYTWCVDPIDGTTNFFHGFHYTSVSIGLLYKGKSILGVVHCPILDETYYGIDSQGAFKFRGHDHRAATRIQVDDLSELPDFDASKPLKKAVILTEFGYDRSKSWGDSLGRRLSGLVHVEQIRAVRCFGSCTINMCFVAEGKAHAYFEGKDQNEGPKPWDFAAAMCVVKEAGGFVVQTNGAEMDIRGGNVLCCSSKEIERMFVVKKYANANW